MIRSVRWIGVLLVLMQLACGSTGSTDGGSADGGAGGGGGTDGGEVDAGGVDGGGVDGGGVDAGGVDAGAPDGGALLLGDTCQNAEILTTFPAMLTATTESYASNYEDPTDTTCGSTRGRDRLYFVNVPTGQILNATVVSPVAGGNDPSIGLILGPAVNCDAMPPVCVATDNSGDETTLNAVQYANTTAAAQGVFILIDNYQTDDFGGPFDLAVNVAPPPVGDVCGTAQALTSGVALNAQSTAGYTQDYVGAGTLCSPSSAGPDRTYAITVPNNERLTVQVTAAAGFDPSISLVQGSPAVCAATPRVCVANNNSGGAGGVDVAQYTNRSGATQLLSVVIDSATALGGGYSILATLDVPPANGDQCQAPNVLPTDGGVLAHTTVNFSNDYSGAGLSCAPASGGPDRVYSLTVPTGLRAQVTVTPRDAGFDPSLSVLGAPAANCDARDCLSNVNAATSGLAETISIISPLPDGGTRYFVVVDSASVTGGPYNISAVLQSNLVGETCASAAMPPITATASFTDSTLGYSNDYNPIQTATNCTPYREAGRDKVYAVTLGPGATLNVLVTPMGVDDPAIYLLSSLAACVATPAVCLAGADMGGEQDLETFTYVNPVSAGAVTHYLVVDSYDTRAISYTVDITIN